MCEGYEVPEKEVVPNKKMEKEKQFKQEEKPLTVNAKTFFYRCLSSLVISMDELKNQASKIKREQEKQLDEMTKISLEQKSVNEIINTYEKEKRKLEEDLSGINLTQDN